MALLTPLIGFVVYEALRAPDITATAQAAALGGEPDGRPARAVTSSAAAPSARASEADGDRDAASIRLRLRSAERGTYIAEILASRDSALARWPDRTTNPVRVWVQSGTGLPGWDPVFAERAREAFDEWSALGIPVRFSHVADSARADIHVRWVDHFREPISGKTLWARDRRWWIVSGAITLALHHSSGEALDAKAVRAIALHEVGHLLGLDHTADTTNIMTPRVRVRDLSAADRSTMKLLYTVPAGSVK